jgi:hypothetical protein
MLMQLQGPVASPEPFKEEAPLNLMPPLPCTPLLNVSLAMSLALGLLPSPNPYQITSMTHSPQ